MEFHAQHLHHVNHGLLNCKARTSMYGLIDMSTFHALATERLDEMVNKGWYVNSVHISIDKRRSGMYVWIKISKENMNVMTWCTHFINATQTKISKVLYIIYIGN